MMSSTYSGVLSLVVIYLSWHAAAATVHRTESILVESLAANCQFTLDGLSFNLCPLIREPPISLEVKATWSSPRRTYKIDLGEHAQADQPLAALCPSGTWICMTESSIFHPGPESIAGRSAGGNSYPSLDARRHVVVRRQSQGAGGESISVHFLSGQPKGAIVEFSCASRGSGKQPEFLGVDDRGVHSFIWATEYACPRSADTLLRVVSGDAIEKEPSDKEPSEEENPNNGKDTDKDSGGKEPDKKKDSDKETNGGSEPGKKKGDPEDGGSDKEESPDKEPSGEPDKKKDPKDEKGDSGKHRDGSEGEKESPDKKKESEEEKTPDKNKDSGKEGGSDRKEDPEREKRPSKEHSDKKHSHHDDGEQDEKELVQIPDHRHHSVTTILFLTGSGLIVAAMLIHSPPRRLRRLVRRYVKPGRFRVGEVSLVRWANEDMGVLDDEEGTMVNDDANDFVVDDEHIPLKPNPRKSFAHYGSAQS